MELCPHSTAHGRFQEWVAAGEFQKLWGVGVEWCEELKGLDWNWLRMDGASTKTPLGREKNRAYSHGPRSKRGQRPSADRRAWRARGLGGGRGEPPRHEIGERHGGQRGGEAAPHHPKMAARDVSGQRVRVR